MGGRSGGSDENWNAGREKGFIKLTKEDKAMLLCEHCGFNGHEVSTSFKKYGMPEWYKELKGKRSRTHASNVEYEQKYINQHCPDQKKGSTAPDLQVILQQFQEMAAFMEEKDKDGQNMNYDQFVDF